MLFLLAHAGKDLNGPKKQRKHLARIQAFTEASLNATALDGSPLLLALVRKLQVMTLTLSAGLWVVMETSLKPALKLVARGSMPAHLQHATLLPAASLLASTHSCPENEHVDDSTSESTEQDRQAHLRLEMLCFPPCRRRWPAWRTCRCCRPWPRPPPATATTTRPSVGLPAAPAFPWTLHCEEQQGWLPTALAQGCKAWRKQMNVGSRRTTSVDRFSRLA